MWQRMALLGDARAWRLGMGLTVLGIGAWWLWRALPPDAERAPRMRQPDSIVWGLSALETDANGQPSRHLHTPQLRHYLDEHRSELDTPRFELYRAEGAPWLAEAQLGVVEDDGKQIRLSGAVQFNRAATAVNRAVHLETERLDLWPETGLAETDQPVRLESDGDSMTANGLKLWYLDDASRTNLHGRVRLRFMPESAPPAAPAP